MANQSGGLFVVDRDPLPEDAPTEVVQAAEQMLSSPQGGQRADLFGREAPQMQNDPLDFFNTPAINPSNDPQFKTHRDAFLRSFSKRFQQQKFNNLNDYIQWVQTLPLEDESGSFVGRPVEEIRGYMQQMAEQYMPQEIKRQLEAEKGQREHNTQLDQTINRQQDIEQRLGKGYYVDFNRNGQPFINYRQVKDNDQEILQKARKTRIDRAEKLIKSNNEGQIQLSPAMQERISSQLENDLREEFGMQSLDQETAVQQDRAQSATRVKTALEGLSLNDKKAVRAAKKALQTNPNHPEALRILEINNVTLEDIQ